MQPLGHNSAEEVFVLLEIGPHVFHNSEVLRLPPNLSHYRIVFYSGSFHFKTIIFLAFMVWRVSQ